MADYSTKSSDLPSVLNALLKGKAITSGKLANQINIPRATINNIVQGKTTDPRASTLEAIANYFEISVDQLLGKTNSKNNESDVVPQKLIPVISWDRISSRDHIISNLRSYQDIATIPIDINLEGNQFAMQVIGDAMWPQFEEGSILVIDPNKQPKNRDFVIAHIKQNEDIIFRQLYTEGHTYVLKAFNSVFPSLVMANGDFIIGTVIQTRNEYV